MPVAQLKAFSATDTMKSDDGNDSLDTFIRQTVGKEPSLSFSRTGDSSVQLYQLLHALKQQDLPGWPLLSPVKVQMQKCEKCSREFCSSINYRRHKRVHRRSLNVDKECHKTRDLMGAFWDKLSLDEVKEIVSFNDVYLEEVPGSSIIRELTSFIRKPGFCTLPEVYARAGSALMDLIHARPSTSRLPISSQELFRILDDASERTFLCAGTAESVQKYVFDGEAGKIGLEMNNLVACTSLLVEQKLVKAWLADKDAEALRCQKLLVEEEEAAQKRKAELLERKRLKQLRQKEQKGKDQSNGEKTDLMVIADTLHGPASAEASSSPSAYESSSDSVGVITNHVSLFEPAHVLSAEEDEDIEALFGLVGEHPDSGTCESVECQTMQRNGRRRLVNARWQVPKSQRGGRNGFHANQNIHSLKLEPMQKHRSRWDPRPGSAVNGSKVWARKPKPENNGETFKTRLQETINQTDQNTKCELMIGAISLTLGNCTVGQQGDDLAEDPANSCSLEHATAKKKNSIQETHTKADSVQPGSVKLWRPVSRNEARGSMPVQSGGNGRTLPSESCIRLSAMDENGNESGNNTHLILEGSAEPEGLLFSSRAAKAFLAQRWNEAIAAEHVKLVISQESEFPECCDANDDCEVAPDFPKRSILGNAENRLAIGEALEYSATRSDKAKFRPKTEKNINKIKYIPKQKTVT